MTELDQDALRDRLSRLGVTDVHPLTGGASSLTFRGLHRGRALVVKVALPRTPSLRHSASSIPGRCAGWGRAWREPQASALETVEKVVTGPDSTPLSSVD